MSITEQIREFLKREVALSPRDPKISDSTSLLASGLLDSISKMKLITFLERTFGLAIEASDVEQGHLETIASIEKFVRSRKAP